MTTLLSILLLLASSCNSVEERKVNNPENTVTFEFEYLGGDTCYFLKRDSASLVVGRTVTFLENTIPGRVLFGHGLIPARFTGRVMYSKFQDRDDMSLYMETFEDADRSPGTDRFWMRPAEGNIVKGNFKVRVRLDSVLYR